jgi:hypothetical protein
MSDVAPTTTVLETLRTEIAQLAQVVKDHKSDPATIDVDKLAGVVAGLVDTQVKNTLQQQEDQRPVRRGEIIGAPGFEGQSLGVVRGGKFDGKRVQDVYLTKYLIDRMYAARKDSVKPASRELIDVVQKEMSATGSTAGDEWVPTGMAAELWQDMFLASRVGGTLSPIDMPTDPFDDPLAPTSGTWRKGTSNTAITAQDVTTAKSTLTSTEQVYEVDWAYDLDEDAIMAVLPSLRTELARSGAEQIDNFILNADSTDANTGNINSDDANPADDSYYLTNGQDGIRHLFLVDNSAQTANTNAVLTDALLVAGIGRLGKYAADVSNLAIVTDPKTYVYMLSLTNVATMDKFGPNATILTGQLANYMNIPVIASASMALTDQDGKYTTTSPSSNDVYGSIAIYHRNMWRLGFRRKLLIEVDQLIQKRQFIMVVSFRIAVAARGTRSTATHTAGLHDIKYS